MTELAERFGVFDRLDVPELWDEVRRREGEPGPPRQRHGSKRLVTIVVALAIGSIAPLIALKAFKSAPGRQSQAAAGIRLTDPQLLRAGSSLMVVAKEGVFKQIGHTLALVGKLPATGISESAFAVDGSHLVMAIASGAKTVDIFTSADGGASWTPKGRRSVSTYSGIGQVHIASMDSRIVVLVDEATNVNFSFARVLVSANGGATWTEGPAPAGGDITSAGGVFWLGGGVIGDALFVSKDGLKWRPVTTPTHGPGRTFGVPVAVTGFGVVVPITEYGPSPGSRVLFQASSDTGKTWNTWGFNWAVPQMEPGVMVPTSVTVDGEFIIVRPDGSRAFGGSGGNLSMPLGGNPLAVELNPKGLPQAVVAVVLGAAGDGLAISETSSCPNGKDSCTGEIVLLHTSDSGRTWKVMSAA